MDSLKEDNMDSREIFDLIRAWEYDAGESFVDYWGYNLNVPNFMFWCVGKGVLTQAQFNVWERDFQLKGIFDSLKASDPNYFIDGDTTEELAYAIGDMDNEQFYGLITLSQFIADSMIYQKRLMDFLNNVEGD
jgi:hypothetical protein